MTRYQSIRLRFKDLDYVAICKITEPHRAPHVGADHPRFMEPGSPGAVEVQNVLWEGIDLTERLSAPTRRKVEAAARQAIGMPAPAPQPQGRLL
jgi:hypothetical protein